MFIPCVLKDMDPIYSRSSRIYYTVRQDFPAPMFSDNFNKNDFQHVLPKRRFVFPRVICGILVSPNINKIGSGARGRVRKPDNRENYRFEVSNHEIDKLLVHNEA